MSPDQTPQPPFIVGHEIDGDRGVLVTWSLPGLRRATVRVPVDAWLSGDHAALGDMLAERSAPPRIEPDDITLDDDDD